MLVYTRCGIEREREREERGVERGLGGQRRYIVIVDRVKHYYVFMNIKH